MFCWVFADTRPSSGSGMSFKYLSKCDFLKSVVGFKKRRFSLKYGSANLLFITVIHSLALAPSFNLALIWAVSLYLDPFFRFKCLIIALAILLILFLRCSLSFVIVSIVVSVIGTISCLANVALANPLTVVSCLANVSGLANGFHVPYLLLKRYVDTLSLAILLMKMRFLSESLLSALQTHCLTISVACENCDSVMASLYLFQP